MLTLKQGQRIRWKYSSYVGYISVILDNGIWIQFPNGNKLDANFWVGFNDPTFKSINDAADQVSTTKTLLIGDWFSFWDNKQMEPVKCIKTETGYVDLDTGLALELKDTLPVDPI